MQDFHRRLRKCPALLGQRKFVQYKDKSFICAHATLGNQLWSCLVLGTIPPKACPAASHCQCYTHIITHFGTKSTFGHPEAPMSRLSLVSQQSRGRLALLQEPTDASGVSDLLQNLRFFTEVKLCAKLQRWTATPNKSTGRLVKYIHSFMQSPNVQLKDDWIAQLCIVIAENSSQLYLLWLADDNNSSPSVSP